MESALGQLQVYLTAITLSLLPNPWVVNNSAIHFFHRPTITHLIKTLKIIFWINRTAEIKILMQYLKTLCLIKDQLMLLINLIQLKLTSITIKILRFILPKLINSKRLRMEKVGVVKAMIFKKVKKIIIKNLIRYWILKQRKNEVFQYLLKWILLLLL